MIQTFIQHGLAADAILYIWLFVYQYAEGMLSCDFAFEIAVKCTDHFIVGNATDNHVVIGTVIASPAIGNKFEPVAIVRIEPANFPVRGIVIKFI